MRGSRVRVPSSAQSRARSLRLCSFLLPCGFSPRDLSRVVPFGHVQEMRVPSSAHRGRVNSFGTSSFYFARRDSHTVTVTGCSFQSRPRMFPLVTSKRSESRLRLLRQRSAHIGHSFLFLATLSLHDRVSLVLT